MAGVHESFVSSTYWTESIGPTAALATLAKMQAIDVPAHIAAIGEQVRGNWSKYAAEFALPVVVDDGYPCLAHFSFEHERARELMTYYTQLMLERGFLAGGAIYPTLAHTSEIVSAYGAAIREAFAAIREALDANQIEQRLKGPVAHSGFRRLT
jgi:glutamate-1-semialdehyde 2,1-aminomutase